MQHIDIQAGGGHTQSLHGCELVDARKEHETTSGVSSSSTAWLAQELEHCGAASAASAPSGTGKPKEAERGRLVPFYGALGNLWGPRAAWTLVWGVTGGPKLFSSVRPLRSSTSFKPRAEACTQGRPGSRPPGSARDRHLLCGEAPPVCHPALWTDLSTSPVAADLCYPLREPVHPPPLCPKTRRLLAMTKAFWEPPAHHRAFGQRSGGTFPLMLCGYWEYRLGLVMCICNK